MSVVEDQFAKVTSKQVAIELCEVLCISVKGIRSIKIDVTAGRKPTVTIEKYDTKTVEHVTRRDMQGIKSVIKNYAFMEFAEGQDNE